VNYHETWADTVARLRVEREARRGLIGAALFSVVLAVVALLVIG